MNAEAPTQRVTPKDLSWFSDTGVEVLAASLSEGRCPRCASRLTQVDYLFDPGDLDCVPKTGCYARGGCASCLIWLAAGDWGDDGGDWVAVVLHGNGGASLTYAMNPPKDYLS